MGMGSPLFSLDDVRQIALIVTVAAGLLLVVLVVLAALWRR